MDRTALPSAEIAARDARDRFFRSLAAVEEHMRPSHLIDDALVSARSDLHELPSRLTEYARAQPAKTATAVAATLLLLMHRPLFRMVRATVRHLS